MSITAKKALLFSALMSTPIALAYAEPINRDEVMTQEIVQPLNTATLDDYRIDMARATDINVIVDATDFSTNSAVKPYPSMPAAIAGLKGNNKGKWGPILINVMADFASQEKLSLLRSDARTFLFWSEPDPRQLMDAEWAVTDADEAARSAQALVAAQADACPKQKFSGKSFRMTKCLRCYGITLKQSSIGWELSLSVAKR